MLRTISAATLVISCLFLSGASCIAEGGTVETLPPVPDADADGIFGCGFCNDWNPCTLDACGSRPPYQCMHFAETDGTVCGVGMVCSSGTCTEYCDTAADCDAPPCSIATCFQHQCLLWQDQPCDVCDDGNECTFDVWESGCQHKTVPLDGTDCTTGGDSGQCIDGHCTEHCTINSDCQPVSGFPCASPVCVGGLCNPIAQAPDGTSCLGGTCQAGVCVAEVADADEFILSSCVVKPDGARCPSPGCTGDPSVPPCLQDWVCEDHKCIEPCFTDADCSDEDPCTYYYCKSDGLCWGPGMYGDVVSCGPERLCAGWTCCVPGQCVATTTQGRICTTCSSGF